MTVLLRSLASPISPAARLPRSVGHPTVLAIAREPGRQARKVEEMWPRASTRPVVLIVEDEILLLMDAMDFLEAAGSEVVDAKNADDAIAIL